MDNEPHEKVTLALLGQKLDTFIEEERQWRLEFASRMGKMDDRQNKHEDRVAALDVRVAESLEEHKSMWRELDNLKGRVLGWDVLNTMGGVALFIWGLIRKQ